MPDTDAFSRKRRRLITSCSECFRRKQKCDKQRPCQHCLRREVPDQCHYEDKTNQDAQERFISALTSSEPDPSGAHGVSSRQVQQLSPPIEGLRYQRTDDGFIEATISNGAYRRLKTVDQGPNALQLKFRDAIALLPSLPVLESLIDIYFNECHWHFAIIEPVTYDPVYSQWRAFLANSVPNLPDLSTEQRYFLPMLLSQLAIAVQYLDFKSALLEKLNLEQASDVEKLSKVYNDSSTIVLDALGRTNAGSSLLPIRTDLLRTWWYKSRGKGSENWLTLAMAIHHAQELCLHLKTQITPELGESLEQTLTRVWAEEERRRLWVFLVFIDAQVAMLLNRPRCINLADCDLGPPIDCPFPREPHRTLIVGDKAMGLEREPPSAFSAQLFLYKLGLRVHKLHDLASLIRRDSSKAKELSPYDLHQDVLKIVDELPAYLKYGPDTDHTWDNDVWILIPQRQILLSTVHMFISNLHRLFMQTRPESRLQVIESGLEILQTQEWFASVAQPHQHRFYGIAFPNIHASLLIFGVIESYPATIAGREHEVTEALDASIIRLSKIAYCNVSAQAGLQLLRPWRERTKHLFDQDWSSSASQLHGAGSSTPSPDNTESSIATEQTVAEIASAGPDWEKYDFGTNSDFDVEYWMKMMDGVFDVSQLLPAS